MRVCLNLDDFNVVHNRFDLLLKLKEHFPNFKISMFTIASEPKMDWGPNTIRKEYLERVKENLDWIQIIPHSLVHERKEVKGMGYDQFKKHLGRIEEAFKKDGLPYVKGFKAPHWSWNKDVVRVLDDLGWWGAVLRDDFAPMPTPKRFYKFTHLLNEPFPIDTPILKLHGHLYGTKNDIGRCYENLLKLPRDTVFEYITEHIET